jgi:hypothetical protein
VFDSTDGSLREGHPQIVLVEDRWLENIHTIKAYIDPSYFGYGR